MRELQNVYQNMQQQTITWDHLGIFITTMVRIMQLRVINSVTIVDAINSLQNVTTLTNFDFNDFLRCVKRETAIQLTISPNLCRIIVAFIQFFQKTYLSITLTLFTYENSDNLIVSTNSMHIIVVQLYEFFTRIYFFIMQTNFVYTNSDGFVETTAMLYSRVEALTASAQTTTIVSNLQGELRRERVKVNNLEREKNSAIQSASEFENRYKNIQSENDSLNAEIERLTPLAGGLQTLSLDKKELLRENNRLKEANTKLQSENLELLKRSSQNYENFKNEQIKVKEKQEKSKELEKRLQDAEDMQTQNVNNDTQKIITELKRSLTNTENQLQEVKTLHSTKLSELQSEIDLNAVTYRAKLASLEQEFNRTINERNDTIKQLNETLAAGNLQYDELVAQLKAGEQELINSRQRIIELESLLQTNAKNKGLSENDQELIEFLLSTLNSLYISAKEIDPNMAKNVDFSQDKSGMSAELAYKQQNALIEWFNKLTRVLAANDILNLNSISGTISLRNKIAEIIPANIIKSEPEDMENFDNNDIINGVRTLVSEYNRLNISNTTLNDERALIATCSQQIAALQEDLRKNKEDVAQINNLVQTSPQLNNKTIQLIKAELETAKSQLTNLKKATTEQLKQMADAGVQVEMSKLNTQIEEINSLLLNYRSVTQDIFDWKTNMMELYESLARTSAEMETI